MKQYIKKILKKSLVYDIISEIRTQRTMRLWKAQDQNALDFYSKFINSGETCFDIGANIGNRTKIFLKLGAKVIAVEPQRKCLKLMQNVYGANNKLVLIQKAVGESEGEAEIMISDANTLSSLSEEWIAAVRKSGRFSQNTWKDKELVKVTTIDMLIRRYGIPSFIKIDVEGFEYQVIKGLTQPIRNISIEFTPEIIDSAISCINYLSRFKETMFNYELYEHFSFASSAWLTSRKMIDILTGFKGDNKIYGNVYARCNV